MTKHISQNFFGIDPKMWLGIVEDRNDPLQMGRLKVRIHGYHTDDKTLIPTADLPWAFPIMPLNMGGGVSGVGESSNVMIGALVTGFWGDWPDCQNPLVFGILNQIEGTGSQRPGSTGRGGTLHQPGNQINDQTSAGGAGTIEPTGEGPAWLRVAQGELKKGIKEWPGSSHNPEVLKYGKAFGFTTDDSSHPWCSAFVHWCLKNSGQSTQGITGMAKSHLTASCYETIQEPRLGCVAVYHRGGIGGPSGHVGFWMGRSAGRDKLLGGNQSNAVTISPYSTSLLAGYRWPRGGGQ